jgi:molybdenum-dependent DNA-binding transcriptional regulator ModE
MIPNPSKVARETISNQGRLSSRKIVEESRRGEGGGTLLDEKAYRTADGALRGERP